MNASMRTKWLATPSQLKKLKLSNKNYNQQFAIRKDYDLYLIDYQNVTFSSINFLAVKSGSPLKFGAN